MKKLAYIIVALCINLAVHGQYKNVKVEPTDTIFKLGGAVLLVDVTKVTFFVSISTYCNLCFLSDHNNFLLSGDQTMLYL